MAGFFADFLRATWPQFAAPVGRPLAWIGLASLAAITLLLAGLGVTSLLGQVAAPSPQLYNFLKKCVVLAGTLLVAGCLGCYLRGIAPQNFIFNSFHYLGNRTYSMYLWQQPLTIGGLVPGFVQLFGHSVYLHPIGALLSIPIGALSFHFFERPFMSKYKRQSPPNRPSI
jgi:peptidoglycan/LPS O-acetylase OafA/YrhL